MGIVDQAKALRATATDRLLPQKFVFHHVPKCGGTSVGRALRKRYLLSQATVTPESSFRAFEAFTERTDREQMLIDVLDLREQMLLYHMFEGVMGISLHVRFSQAAYDAFADQYKFVTILRDPVARFLSHYNWSYDKPHAHARIEKTFDAFLETERAARLGATYVEYYCGLPKDDNITSDAAITAAVKNLNKFTVIGDLSNLNKFESDIKETLQVRIRIRHENRATEQRRVTRASHLSDSIMEKVKALCAPDIAIYEAVTASSPSESAT
jgi:hypothetical protein